MEISRDKFLASLVPDASKIWIVERPYRGDPGNARDIGYGILMSAEKLCVPRWIKAGGEKAEGLCAPRPCQKKSWLDVKGGFLDAEGKPVTKIKIV